jgi:hypothetical protein
MAKEMEMELDPATLAAIALYVYKEWQKSQQPPLFATTPFDVWCEKIAGEVQIREEYEEYEEYYD